MITIPIGLPVLAPSVLVHTCRRQESASRIDQRLASIELSTVISRNQAILASIIFAQLHPLPAFLVDQSQESTSPSIIFIPTWLPVLPASVLVHTCSRQESASRIDQRLASTELSLVISRYQAIIAPNIFAQIRPLSASVACRHP